MKYINVVVDNNSRHTDGYYTYGTEENLRVGQRVVISFGKGARLKHGYVFQTQVVPDCPLNKIKEVKEVDKDVWLSEEMISTIKWMKARYGIKYLDGIKCFVPNGKLAKEGKEKEPYKDLDGENTNIKELTQEQSQAVSKISQAIINNKQENFLIHGVTSSGKTEVYIQLIKQTLNQGKTAIMLVPEIALTKQIIDRFITRFGKDNIAVLHSKLTKRERFDEWMRIRRGEAKVVIGARLGVFAPLENIGIIVLDEEHEATYKSDQIPKYETVDVALKRLMYYNGVLVLGSATPSVVSYKRAKDGIYNLVELKNRYNKTPLPDIELIDMKQELKNGNRTIFSKKLYDEIEANLKAKRQIILFLNRRGYSTYILCKDCGEPLKCPDCGITLTYHKGENAGVCHYCGRRFKPRKDCPNCKSDRLLYLGMGTEKVEESVSEFFKDAKIERFDLDTAKNKKSIERIINNFAKGKTDILIGTQLVAKGLDFKNVGLVGVISADTTLNIPDFRSSERTFQLVTQVAGRAGRGNEKGKVIVQSFTPENFALMAAKHHNYTEFFDQEIRIRGFMNYPPFSDLIMVLFTSKDKELANEIALELKTYLSRCNIEEDDKNIFNPKLSEGFIGNESYRYYVLIKSPKGLRNKYVFYIDSFGRQILEKGVNCTVTIDVNPYSIY